MNLLRVFSALVLWSFLLSCSSDSGSGLPEGLEIVERTDAYDNIERYSRRVDNYAKEGQFMRIDPDGNMIELANYQNDTLQGPRIMFAENGDTIVLENYQNGIFDGEYRSYYEGNILELVGSYTANYMEGEWKRYYKNGQLMEVVGFSDNEENGPFIEYHENGNLKAEGFYRNGDHEHGLLKLYDEAGELEKTMNCENGICRTVWSKEGGAVEAE
ncbi:MAG: toxin-antitoxin system YwqK family antitoxin [Saprospiraceae bacterium]|nr:toxin-antitoxin system YwqK family antitoxin [Saprospiraceae bacterium]